jgi:hypothetical protein
VACAAPDWHADAITFGPPIVAAGAVWVANNGGGLYAFNATTGVQIYHSAGFGINRFVTPSEAGGQVFVPSHTVIKSFTFAAPPPPPPSVVSLSPNNGLIAGGTSVTITGTNFTGATAVNFGTASATYTVNSATQITATSPPGSGLVDVTVTAPTGTSAISAAAKFAYTLAPTAYTTQNPSRILDTRDGTGGVPVAPLGSGATLSLVPAGVPPGATGVVLNVTVVNPTAAGFLAVFPTTGSHNNSNLNWVAGQGPNPNLVESKLSSSGSVSFFNSAGSTDVVADLEGYFAPSSGSAGGEVALTPARITDTRAGSGFPNAGNTLSAGGTLNVSVLGAGGVGGVPLSGVSAVILNVTAVDTTTAGYFTVYPTVTGTPTVPTASNLNWVAGQIVPNRAIVQIGAGGMVSIFNKYGSADAVVDVTGYFSDGTVTPTGKQFTPQDPQRIADTRFAFGCPTNLGTASTCTLPIANTFGVPSNATAVILNVTATNSTAPSFLTVYPSTAATRPTASDLNLRTGVNVANMVVATIGSNGAITIYNSAGSTDVVVDLLGWFS